MMDTFLQVCRAAAIAALVVTATNASAAAPDVGEPDAALPEGAAIGPTMDYALETEMVVHDWVICVSQPLAEQLVRAREAGVESARQAYAGLASSRSCGRFPQLRVILRDPLYASSADAGYDARIFAALVNLSGDWASAFLVSGGLGE